MLNFSFLFGDELRMRALDAGASVSMAANPIWALAVVRVLSQICSIAFTCCRRTEPGLPTGKQVRRRTGYWVSPLACFGLAA